MTFRLNLNSITTRLILMGSALFTIGMLGRILLLSDYMRNDLTELASAQLLTMANYVAADIDRDVVDRRQMLQQAARAFPVKLLQDRRSLQRWLGERHNINPLFSLGMFVLDPSGMMLADYPVLAGRSSISYANDELFRQAMQGEFVIGRPNPGATHVPQLPMAMPLHDASGKVRAVLVGVVALHSPNFLEALYHTHIGETGGLVLVSPRDKLFLGASDADIALKPTPQQGVHAQHDNAMKGWRGVGIDVREGGTEELAAVASVPNSSWFIVARIPTSEVFAPLSRLHSFILNNTLYLVPLFFLIVVSSVYYLLRPLMHAARHADRMTLGEIPLEPLPVARNDEVGHLTTAFNRLLSKLMESNAQMEHLAHHDILTGLPNRQLLADRMKQALVRAQRSHSRVAVLFLDLDGFKPINDEMGHEAGDLALHEVAQRLQKAVRSEDTLARVGGDEFVVLLSDLEGNGRAVAELVANKCLEVFRQPFIIHGRSCSLGSSIGISVGDGQCAADELLIAADLAMYQAKQGGRGKLCWATSCADCLSAGRHAVCGVSINKNGQVSEQ